MKLLVATTNKGKLSEIRAILAPENIEVLGLADIGCKVEVEEDGATFLENALLKARTLNRATGLPTLADDSGLAVKALGGRPGVHTARFAGPAASDRDNYEKLLADMEGVPAAERGAEFVCAMALVGGADAEYTSEGRFPGSIGFSPRGTGGFGYDPVFLLEGGEMTLAEAEAEHKNAVSHRGIALAAMLPHIRGLLRRG